MSQDNVTPTVKGPGVYINEPPGPATINAVSTSTAIFLGETELGAVDGPQLITSWNAYVNAFGGLAWGLQTPAALYAFFQQGGALAYVSRMARPGAFAAHTMVEPIGVRAASPGAWGNGLSVRITNSPMETPPVEAEAPVFALQILHRIPDSGAETANEARIAAFAARNQISAQTIEGERYWILESYPGLTARDLDKPDADTPCPLESRVNGASLFARVKCVPGAGVRPKNVLEPQALTGGIGDDETTPADYTAGLAGLDGLVDASILLCPEISSGEGMENMRDLGRLVLTYCENRPNRDLFAVMDAPFGLTPLEAVDFKTGAQVRGAPSGEALNSSYGAIYYPWIYIYNQLGAAEIPVAPAGAIAGLYAAADQAVGPWQAPAGTANGAMIVATGLERDVSSNDQDQLNPNGVNAIRNFTNYGILAFGARTLSADPGVVYLSVRRTLIMIENSLRVGLHWVVFEPSTPQTWGNVIRSVTAFLTSLWRQGALFGTTAAEALWVTCDESNNPPEMAARGELNVSVGVSMVNPSEFTVISLKFQTAAAPAD